MSYDYTNERKFVFTEVGIVTLLKIRDRVQKLLLASGAVREQEIHSAMSGDSWQLLACVDYLVERGEIRRVHAEGVRQHNVYISNQ